MPLQLIFHLELAKPSAITTVWDPEKDRLRVVAISGGGNLVKELRQHAAEAGLTPTSPYDPRTPVPEEVLWVQLEAYNGFTEEVRRATDLAFAEIFDHLQIQQESMIGQFRNGGEIRLFMQKPDGSHTNAWVWKDNLTWIQVAE